MGNDKLTEKAKLAALKQWFVENSKLPVDIDDVLLKRFLRCMHGDIDETKSLIEHHYALRTKNPHIFVDRDPNDESIREFYRIYDMIPLPGLTPEGNKVFLFRFNDKDPTKMNTILECKTFHLLADCRFTMSDMERNNFSTKKEEQHKKNIENEQDEEEFLDANEEIIVDTADNVVEDDNDDDDDDDDDEFRLAAGDISILDMTNSTWSHMVRVSFATMRVQMKFVQEAYPMRLSGSHMINCPSYVHKLISFIRPFIKDEVFGMMRVHTNGMDGLFDYIPRDMLPNEYGGNAGPIEELKQNWWKVLEEKRPYLTDPKYWKVEKPQSGRWSLW